MPWLRKLLRLQLQPRRERAGTSYATCMLLQAVHSTTIAQRELEAIKHWHPWPPQGRTLSEGSVIFVTMATLS